MAEWVRALDWRPDVQGSNPTAENFSLRNFGNSFYPALPVSFGGDTKSRRSLLYGVYARGSKRSHQSALECVTVVDYTAHSKLPQKCIYAAEKRCPALKKKKKKKEVTNLQRRGSVTSMTWGASLYLPPDSVSSAISSTIFSRGATVSATSSITSVTRPPPSMKGSTCIVH